MLEYGLFSCVTFCFRSLGRFERCFRPLFLVKQCSRMTCGSSTYYVAKTILEMYSIISQITFINEYMNNNRKTLDVGYGRGVGMLLLNSYTQNGFHMAFRRDMDI